MNAISGIRAIRDFQSNGNIAAKTLARRMARDFFTIYIRASRVESLSAQTPTINNKHKKLSYLKLNVENNDEVSL